jgi:predicted Zn-dependent peptidase
MSLAISKLANGLTVVSDPIPHLESASLGVWVNCGARNETRAQMGLSHMLEHMAFKGTARRSAKQIAVEIEAVGGDLNAYTAREQTAFHARVLKEDVGLALDLLADILLHPTFDAAEMEREREVIVQEIGQTRDTPDELVMDHLQTACYPDQPMGWPILGTEQTVTSFVRGDLRTYMGAHYLAGDMMLIASGAVSHEALVAAANELFGDLPAGTAAKPELARFQGGDIREDDDLEQVHLAYAFPGVSMAHEDAMAAQIYTTALGGGMSSRLFQEVREKRGLCYAISAFAHSYRDGGLVGIYTGTSDANAAAIAPIVAGEMQSLAESATEEEAARARAQLRASVLMSMESPSARCEQIATHLLAFGRVWPVAETLARIEAVDASALRLFGSRLCEAGNPAIAAVGPAKRHESRESFAARFGAAHVQALR